MMNPADLGGCEGREFDPPVETLDIESLEAVFPLSTCIVDREGPHGDANLKETTVTNSREVNRRVGREMIRVIYKLQPLPLPLVIMESECNSSK